MDEEVFAFGSFRLIPAQRMLSEEGRPLRLGGRALEILVALTERAGETISKEELIARAWPPGWQSNWCGAGSSPSSAQAGSARLQWPSPSQIARGRHTKTACGMSNWPPCPIPIWCRVLFVPCWG